jgi:glycosyltransferase involved in cell wall biosynthesis
MRSYLLVTEKLSPQQNLRDGGYRLVQSLMQALGSSLDIVQFGYGLLREDRFNISYPKKDLDRFSSRIQNADFIADRVLKMAETYSDILFVHVSMLFGFAEKKPEGKRFWTFPMFLSPSYRLSGELVPPLYFELEAKALAISDHIICPSYLERRQIEEFYHIPRDRVKVIPRGIDRKHFWYTSRFINKETPLVLCSLGSIKRQKNNLELVREFAEIRKSIPNSFLQLIGPVQDVDYFQSVLIEIERLGLGTHISFTGFISSEALMDVLSKTHIHISASNCETFGRSIFETLTTGLPNICKVNDNAAFEFLGQYPFLRSYKNTEQLIKVINEILDHFETLSEMASSVGDIFDEAKIERLLEAHFNQSEHIIISDFDGTLYHKTDPEKTAYCVAQFNNYPVRVICSSRSPEDLREKAEELGLVVDYYIGFGGCVLANSKGDILWVNEIKDLIKIDQFQEFTDDIKPIFFSGYLVQYLFEEPPIVPSSGKFRLEQFQDKSYLSGWKSTKLIAIQKLLDILNWTGRVVCYGDGKYDLEFLSFFDGKLISGVLETSSPLLRSNCIEYEGEIL